MPLVYSFYCKEFVVSLSSRFQSSGWSMSPEDPVSGQVPSGVIGSVPICLCSSKNFIHQNGSSLEVRVLSPKSNFLNQPLIPQAGALLYNLACEKLGSVYYVHLLVFILWTHEQKLFELTIHYIIFFLSFILIMHLLCSVGLF